MDVDRGTVDGTVAQPGFQGKKAEAVLVAVSRVGMPKGMGAEAAVQAEGFPMGKEDPLEPLLIHRVVCICLLSKKPGLGPHVSGTGIPIIPDSRADTFWNGDITVRAVFGHRDIEPPGREENMAALEVAQFVKPQPGSVKNRTGEACFWMAKCFQEERDLGPVRDKGQIGAELAERDLGRIPGLMEDIDPKKLKMGNDHVHSPVRKMAGSLERFQKLTDNIPGNKFGGETPLEKERKVRLDISLIVTDGIGGKIPCLKHFNKNR